MKAIYRAILFPGHELLASPRCTTLPYKLSMHDPLFFNVPFRPYQDEQYELRYVMRLILMSANRILHYLKQSLQRPELSKPKSNSTDRPSFASKRPSDDC